MFPFGSVLSNIPLLVLAFAYLFYVGAAALNKANPVDEPLSSSGKVRNITRPNAKDIQSGVYYFHQQKKADVQSEEIEQRKEQWDFYSSLKFLPPDIAEKKLQSLFCGNDINSRPPPVKA